MSVSTTNHTTFLKDVLDADDVRRSAPDLLRMHEGHSFATDVWVYRYRHPSQPWRLSIATHAEPGSGKLSLGGFRIAPESRTSRPDWDPDREAIGLAVGMEEKVYWSRVLRVGGPLAQRDFTRIVGGKCVLEPTADARVGQPRDFELLDFAIACLDDCESSAGIHITTGQDLGHGTMSDGRTSSLEYLNRGFPGSVVADTSQPTGEGNYHVLAGMLRAFDIPLAQATVGLVGVGNIGLHIFECLAGAGATVLAAELRPERRAELERRGARVFTPEGIGELLRQPVDAVAFNAAGGSLNDRNVELCAANDRLRVICGSENLVMPNPNGAERLRATRKAFCPTELGGMMGYLTAVEEYLAHLEGQPFRVETLMEASRRLDTVGYATTRHLRARDFAISFEEAARDVFAA